MERSALNSVAKKGGGVQRAEKSAFAGFYLSLPTTRRPLARRIVGREAAGRGLSAVIDAG